MRDSIIKLQMQPWLLILELLKYFLFGWGLLLMPIVELSLFIPTRLLDRDTQRMYPTKEDSDASRPENLPDVELMSVSECFPSITTCLTWSHMTDCIWQTGKLQGHKTRRIVLHDDPIAASILRYYQTPFLRSRRKADSGSQFSCCRAGSIHFEKSSQIR